jgi:hypothetical protein
MRGAGAVPAENTSRRLSKDFRKPADIWLRAEFPVQRMSTRGFSAPLIRLPAADDSSSAARQIDDLTDLDNMDFFSSLFVVFT